MIFYKNNFRSKYFKLKTASRISLLFIYFFALMQKSTKKNQGFIKKAKNLNDCLK